MRLHAIAVAARRWRWVGVVAWVALLAVAGLLASGLPARLSGGGWAVPDSASQRVEEAVAQGFLGRGPTSLTLVVHDTAHTAADAAFETRVAEAFDAVMTDPVLQATSAYGWSTLSPEARGAFLGEDGRTVVNAVALALPDGEARQLLTGVQHDLTERFAPDGLEVSLVGAAPFWGEVNHLSETSLFRAELIALPLIVLVVVLLFGGALAALAALAVGVTAILLTFAVLSLIAGQVELSVFVQNAATMLGLGVGVDYSLFLITRFREELAAGRDQDEALATTLRTSGETVLFSGITVVAAMCTLVLVPLGVIRSIALGAVLVVASAVLVSLLLLPMLLALLGPRLQRSMRAGRSSHPRAGSRRWDAFARTVMRRPVAFLAGAVALLLALAVPAAGMSTFTPDARIIPTSSPVRAGFDLVAQEFGPGATAPIRVVVTATTPLSDGAATGTVLALAEDLRALDGVAGLDSALDVLTLVSPGDPLAATAPDVREALPGDVRQTVDHFVAADDLRLVLDVVPEATAADPATQDLLAQVRDAATQAVAGSGTGAGVATLSIDVGGETAQGVDSNEVIADTLPTVVLAMLAVIFVLLLVTFRSVLLPLKAIAVNLLSVGATYGVLVLVFQDGIGASLFGFESSDYVQNFVPVLLLTLLFSLSTDYEVFLLNRVREDYVRTGDDVGSVARGLARTAPLISGAALLMVVVFGAFAFAGILPIQQLGFGLAIGIALDATVVRLVVVPASMRLLGRWNWWLPGRGVPGRTSAAGAAAGTGEESRALS
ncbi:MAG TPA: MMPL family transporter [Micrococcales bacterium]|nr:MMPL family transporter [Micrococcales bacterium]